MKKLFGMILAVFLVLAACGNDSDNKDKEDKTNDAKKEETKKNNDNDKKDKDKDSKKNNDAAKSNDDDNANANNDQNNNQANEQANNEAQGQADNNQAANNGNGVDSNAVANNAAGPYDSQQSVSVAKTFEEGNVDTQAALQNLPDFEQIKNTANQEVNGINGMHNAYNDYAITGDANGYHYVLSFHNASQPGKYFIVNVDANGTIRVVDPAYQV